MEIDDVSISTEPGSAYCQAYAGCPCSNFHAFAPGLDNAGGCYNSAELETELYGTGAASIANDGLVVHAQNIPSTVALYAQGTQSQITAFGDGLRCIAGAVIRLAIHSASGGGDTYPRPFEAPISVTGQVGIGATRYYQIIYRDAASFCTSGTYNTSNGYRVVWQP